MPDAIRSHAERQGRAAGPGRAAPAPVMAPPARTRAVPAWHAPHSALTLLPPLAVMLALILALAGCTGADVTPSPPAAEGADVTSPQAPDTMPGDVPAPPLSTGPISNGPFYGTGSRDYFGYN